MYRMEVTKRNGQKEEVRFDKISSRLRILCNLFRYKFIDPILIAQKTIENLYNGITTQELDELSARVCATLSSTNPIYNKFGGAICISNLHKMTPDTFFESMKLLMDNKDIHNNDCPLLDMSIFDIIKNNKDEIEQHIDHQRDYNYDYFGFKTLEKAYLMKSNSNIVERPQYMLMRVSIGIHQNNLKSAFKTYDLMSRKLFTHASPTLFNAGTKYPQLSSCFLMGTKDNIEGIYKTITDCALISKRSGGIGIHVSNIRASGSLIRTTNGNSDGIVPMLQVYNYTARYINQGGKRPGSFAIYLEPWHADVFSFLDLRKNTGSETDRARDLFLALWIPDKFMDAVYNDNDWYLMCPDECRGLIDVWGDDFDNLYDMYISENKYRKKIKARTLWKKIIESQIETGNPYMLYKDNINKKSNQMNIGTIKSSNLCVAPETKILTKDGYQVISELKDKKLEIWNGKEWSEVEVKQTGKDQELCKVIFSDYTELECTPYHKFYIQESYQGKPIIKEAKNLKTNDKIIKCDYPVIDNNNKLKSAYTNGFFSGDGTYINITDIKPRKCDYKSIIGKAYCKRHFSYQKGNEKSEKCCGISYTKKPHISLYHDKIKLLEHLDYLSKGEIKNKKLNITLRPSDMQEKFFVPHNYSIKSKLDWFAGYSDADGTIVTNQGCQSMQICCIELNFLKETKLMLNTCGLNPKITLMSRKKNSLLPDGKGSHKMYDRKECYRLLINSVDLNKLLELGFNPKRLQINHNHIPNRDARKFTKVKSIEFTNRIDDTYCFTEHKDHKGIFNGIITGQCAEIVEYSDDKETAVCNLASIALNKFVEPVTINGKIKIYSKSNCKYCKLTKMLLKNYNIEYNEILLDDDDQRNTFFDELNNPKCDGDKCTLSEPLEIKTVPQIYINDKRIGGYNELAIYLQPKYNFEALKNISATICKNLNKVIDINKYPTKECYVSNMRHRPIGIGVQGLADTYFKMRFPFESDEAHQLNKEIFEAIYYGSLEASAELSYERELEMNKLKDLILEKNKHISDIPEFYDENYNVLDNLYHKLRPLRKELDRTTHLGSYSTFIGSPFSEGKLQFDLWNARNQTSDRWNWEKLTEKIKKHGTRNSLLTALMPTASTSQILGNNECFEPITSNIYKRRTQAGEFKLINKFLIKDLLNYGIWNNDLKDQIIFYNGSIQNIDSIPKEIKYLYKNVWEIQQKHIVHQAVERGIYIDQTQSMNIFMENADYQRMTSSHFASWKLGLKTGMYYFRTKAGTSAKKFTINAREESECLSCSA